ncbi:MAG TPA: hypothetical protein VGV57_09760, partial [Thermoleophilaceae bacterium]|nr:hypothetical protein [Thermoleophilaceae bacterium]
APIGAGRGGEDRRLKFYGLRDKLWRPPTTHARAASSRPATSRTSPLLSRIREVHAANYNAYGYRRTWERL